MPPIALPGLVLATGVFVVALALMVWQLAERRQRESELSNEDALYFAHRDVRRSCVVLIMISLAAGIFIGSWVRPKWPAGPNPAFVLSWMAVFLLIIALMALAMIDWLATRTYARRHRIAIVREGVEILREEMRLRTARSSDRPHLDQANGHP